ncbi:hypothetical protein [Bacillus sp. KH172YL63]|uniref:hypothetical protein n=1 Tax=Bacillus sp. KH172YL63 TaxID=2709784 RepID=UPI0013E4B625|nr:hypothetical protein [Bacillus sp. KH172YL63]BCB04026.1 hypothetical protein KH172YL63_21590 [Bacillus sp. KH172YL63]
MWWQYYGDAVIAVSFLTVMLVLFGIHFFRRQRKKGFAVPITILLIGYLSFVWGIVFIRGWNGTGFIVYGVIILAIGVLSYAGVGVYRMMGFNKSL